MLRGECVLGNNQKKNFLLITSINRVIIFFTPSSKRIQEEMKNFHVNANAIRLEGTQRECMLRSHNKTAAGGRSRGGRTNEVEC
jgi:hypothetical protein